METHWNTFLSKPSASSVVSVLSYERGLVDPNPNEKNQTNKGCWNRRKERIEDENTITDGKGNGKGTSKRNETKRNET